jgi:hypothetical protein
MLSLLWKTIWQLLEKQLLYESVYIHLRELKVCVPKISCINVHSIIHYNEKVDSTLPKVMNG